MADNQRFSDRYRIMQPLARGHMGHTFLVTDELSDSQQYCVVQQIKSKRLNSPDLTDQLKEIHWWVEQLQVLGRHPQLPQVLDSFAAQDSRFFLVQTYVAGDHLATLLSQGGTWQGAAIWRLLESLLPVLQWIHAHDMIHRDIKPENIILSQLGDRSHTNSSTAAWVLVGLEMPDSTDVVGSPEFAAPEQIQGRAVFASDLYSLGVVCIYLLTGLSPLQLFDVSLHDWVWRNYHIPNSDNSFETYEFEQLAGFLDRLIAPDLTQRFTSTEAAIAELQTLRCKKLAPMLPIRVEICHWECVATLSGHAGLFAGVNAIAIHPQMNFLVSASDDKTVRLWNLRTYQQQHIFSGHSRFVQAVAVHPHLPQLASAGCDRTIKIWDSLTGQISRTLTGHTQPVNTIDFSPQGDLLLSGSSDKTVKLWNVATGELLTTFAGHRLSVNAIAFHPSAHLFASASSDTTICCWRLTQSEPVCILRGHTALVRAIAFSPNGRWIATGGEDRTIRIWEVASGRGVQILSGHPWSVATLCFFPDNTTLISGSWDKTIKLWHWETGQKIATLNGHTDAVNDVTITPDASLIASASQDKTMKLWRMVEDRG